MFNSFAMRNTLVALVMAFAAATGCSAAARAPIPPPASDSPLAQSKGKQTAVFAGGCFWGTQSVFERVKGVISTTAGYSGGSASTATYGQVSEENTGHAESVKVVFDPSKITYGQLLRIFFSVAHDPTQLNRQGPDVGSSYRSVIFYSQRRAAEARQSLHRATGCGQSLSQTDRDRGCSPEGFLRCRVVPPGLRTAQSEQSLHHGV